MILYSGRSAEDDVSQIIDGGKTVRAVVRRMRASAVVWIIIAGFQILLGIPLLLFGIGLSMIACGGWNIYASVTRLNTADLFKREPQRIYPYYEKSLDSIVIFLVINVLFGGVIGVIGSICDLLIRSYVVSHKEELTVGLMTGGY